MRAEHDYFGQEAVIMDVNWSLHEQCSNGSFLVSHLINTKREQEGLPPVAHKQRLSIGSSSPNLEVYKKHRDSQTTSEISAASSGASLLRIPRRILVAVLRIDSRLDAEFNLITLKRQCAFSAGR